MLTCFKKMCGTSGLCFLLLASCLLPPSCIFPNKNSIAYIGSAVNIFRQNFIYFTSPDGQ